MNEHPDDEVSDDPTVADIESLGSGVEAVKQALNRARAAALAKGLRPGQPGSATTSAEDRHAAARRIVNARRRGGRYSGSGPDDRDPQPFGTILNRVVQEQGWTHSMAVGSLIGRWADIVGPELAEHATIETFDDGVLAIRTSSTAWAVQLRLLQAQLHARLNTELGEGVVTELKILAPAAPSWKRGPRTAPGRGPRDTYG